MENKIPPFHITLFDLEIILYASMDLVHKYTYVFDNISLYDEYTSLCIRGFKVFDFFYKTWAICFIRSQEQLLFQHTLKGIIHIKICVISYKIETYDYFGCFLFSNNNFDHTFNLYNPYSNDSRNLKKNTQVIRD